MGTDSAVNYEVNAWLRVRGDFAKQMQRTAKHVAPVQKRFAGMSDSIGRMGQSMMGNTAAAVGNWGKMAAVSAAVAGGAGLGLIVREGMRFNQEMESSKNQIATIFQMFGQNKMIQGQLATESEQWAANLQLADSAFQEIWDIAKESPAGLSDVVHLYQSAASGLATQTMDVTRQMGFIRKAVLAGGLAEGDYKVLGSQIGRILAGSAGAEMNVWQVLKKPLLEAGQQMEVNGKAIFDKAMPLGDKMTQAFNKLGDDSRMKLLEKALERLGGPVAKQFAESMDGLKGTFTSNLQLMAGSFSKPLFEGWRQFLKRTNLDEGGLFDDAGMKRWMEAAHMAGVLLAGAADKVLSRAESAAKFIRDNWERLMQQTHTIFQVGAGLVKGAFMFGVAKWIAGLTLMGFGKGASALGKAKGFGSDLAGFFGDHARRTHLGMGKGLGGRGQGMLGAMGGGLGRILGKLGQGDGIFRWLDKGVLRFAALATTFAGLATAALAVGVAFGVVFAVMGGLAAYIISNWDSIRDSIVKSLDEGRISFVPFLTALYTFWERLKLLGGVLFGGSSGADMMSTSLMMGTKAFELLSDALAFVMDTIATMIGIWGALKLAFLGVMKVIVEALELFGQVGIVDERTLSTARINYERFAAGVDETFNKAGEIYDAADQIRNFELSELDMDQIKKKAKEWERKVADTLSGKGLDRKSPKGPTVHIDNLTIHQDLRDTDPDRLFSAFIKPLERLADQRVQPFEALDAGV